MPRRSPEYDQSRFLAILEALREETVPSEWPEVSYRTRVSQTTIHRLLAGTQPTPATVAMLAKAYPHRALAMHKAAGHPLPAYMLTWNEVAEELAPRAGLIPSEYMEQARRLVEPLANNHA